MTVAEELEIKLTQDVPDAFWLRPDWGDKSNLRDPGAIPFWMRPPRRLVAIVQPPASPPGYSSNPLYDIAQNAYGGILNSQAHRPLSSVKLEWMDYELSE